jgi:hypothetical protein
VVNDGALDSQAAETEFTLHAVTPSSPSLVPVPVSVDAASGLMQGALAWPGLQGDRTVIEASQDLKSWVPIATNAVDFDGRVHFRDAAASQYSHRFYRARGLVSSSLVAYENGFEGTVGPEWTPRAPLDTTPMGSRRFLGPFGAETVSLGLNGLPAHTRVHLSWDLFIIGSWDGNNPESGPDRWQAQVRGGPTLIDATFSTYWNQSYPGLLSDNFPPRTGAAENDTLGYSIEGFSEPDSVYHFDFSFDQSEAALTLDFTGIGLRSRGDERWGLDNVQVEVINNP